MTVQPVARRYAAALIDVTQSGGGQASTQADAISQALTDLAGLIESHSDLNKLIASPTVPPTVKKAVMLAIVEAAGIKVDEVKRLVGLLADRPATCTTGVGYWATDTETLYTATSTNTWGTYYTPYTYPHPDNDTTVLVTRTFRTAKRRRKIT